MKCDMNIRFEWCENLRRRLRAVAAAVELSVTQISLVDRKSCLWLSAKKVDSDDNFSKLTRHAVHWNKSERLNTDAQLQMKIFEQLTRFVHPFAILDLRNKQGVGNWRQLE